MKRTNQILTVDANLIFADPMWSLFEVVGADAGRSAHATAAIFHYEFAMPLWSGRLTEARFWTLFTERVGVMASSTRWRTAVLTATRPLPVLSSLRTLADQYEVWMIANHRQEWLAPVLHSTGADRYLNQTIISSRTGLVQPQPAAYQQLQRLATGRPVLFVTGCEAHGPIARTAGLDTMVADPNDDLVRSIQARDKSNRRTPVVLGAER
jgi:FMN phosphatase YigB (HAD superfamily)